MYVPKPIIRKHIFIVLSILAVFQLSGCDSAANSPRNTNQPDAIAVEGNECHFAFSVQKDADAGITTFSSDELNGNFNHGLEYRDISNVTVEIDDAMIPLEEALRGGLISEIDIFSRVRQDAKDGFCSENCESYLGLNHFTYSYPECDIRIIYDILETPSGEQHLISQLIVFDPVESLLSTYVNFYDKQTGEMLTQEDWGLSFQITQVTNSGMTIQCTQSGGMQIGQLKATAYFLTTGDNSGIPDSAGGMMPPLEAALEMNGCTTLTIEWEDYYGALQSGDYKICISIFDLYDEEDVHPLMQDYHDWQNYEISFTVP